MPYSYGSKFDVTPIPLGGGELTNLETFTSQTFTSVCRATRLGRSPYLSRKRDKKNENLLGQAGYPPKAWGLPPPCKQTLIQYHVSLLGMYHN